MELRACNTIVCTNMGSGSSTTTQKASSSTSTTTTSKYIYFVPLLVCISILYHAIMYIFKGWDTETHHYKIQCGQVHRAPSHLAVKNGKNSLLSAIFCPHVGR